MCGWVAPENTTFTENLTCDGFGLSVQAQGTVIDCAGFVLRGNGSSVGLNISSTDKVTVKNCVIENFERGVDIYQSDNCTLVNNTFRNNTYGIMIQRSFINNITGNNISNNFREGVYLDNKSMSTAIDSNTICGNNQAGGTYLDIRNNAPTIDVPVYPKFIEHMIINISPYNETTQLAGSIIFDHGWNATHIDENRIYKSFGTVHGEEDPTGMRGCAEFVYWAEINASVLSPVNGTITAVTANSHWPDYGMSITPHGYQEYVYMLGVDHINNVTVVPGDNVSAGQVIATPGCPQEMRESWNNDPIHDGQYFGLTELGMAQDNWYLCPALFFTDEHLAYYNATIMRLMAEWEEFIGDTNVYNESAFVLPGCTKLEVPFYVKDGYIPVPNTGADNSCDTSDNYSDTSIPSGCTGTCGFPATTTTLSAATTSTTSTTSTTKLGTTTSSSTSTQPTTTTLHDINPRIETHMLAGWNLISLPLSI